MLNRLTVKGRMYIINAAILVLFVTMVLFSVRNSNGVKDLGIQKTGEVMLEDQKAKIQVASHTAAMMAGRPSRM
jgi:methyl-accepting chemotaxis protein